MNQEIRQDTPSSKPPNLIKAVLVATGLAFFNLVFVLGFFIAIWSVAISFVGVAFASLVAGILIIMSSFLASPLSISLPVILFSHPVLLVSAGLITFSIGGLILIGMLYAIKVLAILTHKYVTWNIDFIRRSYYE